MFTPFPTDPRRHARAATIEIVAVGIIVIPAMSQMAATTSGEDPTIPTVLGAAYAIVHKHSVAARLLEKALALDPNSAWAWNRSGWLQTYLGNPDISIDHFERALRLSPFDPLNFNAYIGIGGAHFAAGRYDDAALWIEKGLIDRPGATWAYRELVAAYTLLGRDSDARAGLLRLYPQPMLDRIAEGLRKAGMAE